jgi:glutamate/aspartate transport system permease protein
MNYNWNWSIYWAPSPEGNGTYFDMLMTGLQWTIATAVCSWIIAFTFGLAVGVMRTMPGRLPKLFGECYVELFRNIPLLVQMFLWYFVLPELLPAAAGTWLKQLPNASFVTAVVCLGLYTSARVAVQVQAGLESLSRGQKMAGLAIGLTPAQTYRYVLLPMGLRIIVPPLTSEFLNNLKNTSVALTIGLLELTSRTRAMQEFSFQVFEAFTAATILYLLINLGVVMASRWLESRLAVPGLIALKK